jgi:fructan beta-fructosidase
VKSRLEWAPTRPKQARESRTATLNGPITSSGRSRHQWRRLAAFAAASAMALGIAAAAGTPASASTSAYNETYRPQFHFSPAQNWMNDPNGLLYYRGEYHLFFQYNPSGNTWGNMSWGHAVSTDLVHWKQLPVAIRNDSDGMIFSGSAVIDYNNTSGFGQPNNPAMVAIYTLARPDGTQEQAIAYSLDDGRTFTKYGVVLPTPNPQDANSTPSNNFRDPKVFWYAPGHEWLMTAVWSDQHKVAFYKSPDLKHWTFLSTFGPAGATGGVWECPDLFPLADPTHPGEEKWVLVVNLNPGGIAGGSGAQYFIGNFDGTTFTSDDKPYTPPAGEDLGSFDDGTFDGWTPSGTAFGSGPTPGNAPGQGGVSGYLGNGLANSFNNPEQDGGTGTLTSPNFVIDKDYLNFLAGGGDHPYVPGSQVGDNQPPGSVFADFEGATWGTGWTATGDFANAAPAAGAIGGQQQVTGYEGNQLVNTFTNGDAATGTIDSPAFTINSHYIDLLVGGGDHPWGAANPTAVNLVVDGKVVDSATGNDAEALNWVSWAVSQYAGQQASIQIVDDNVGGWGHINVDQVTFSDQAAAPRAVDTSVRLVVDGQIVRSATGPNSEALDWMHFDVAGLRGKTAHVELVDNNTGGWGHISADQFSLSDTPALSALQRAHWIDFGSDDYAAVTYNDAPAGKRIMIGWMNNWNYGQSIPTSPWRSAMTVPRDLSLRSVDGTLQLVQHPVQQLSKLASSPVRRNDVHLDEGSEPLGVNGEALRIDTTMQGGTASHYGLKVRTGNGQQTSIGYDQVNHELYIDRSQSGNVSFDPSFTPLQTAPLTLGSQPLKLTILVDWSSVEVFAQNGQVLLTDQIFPDPGSTGVAAYATGGTATIRTITVQQMGSAWTG